MRQQELAKAAIIGVKWQDFLPGCREIAGWKPCPGAPGMPARRLRRGAWHGIRRSGSRGARGRDIGASRGRDI